MSKAHEEMIERQQTLIETMQKEATRQGAANAESNANAIEANVRALRLMEDANNGR